MSAGFSEKKNSMKNLIKEYQFKSKQDPQIEVVDLQNLVCNSKKLLLVPHRTNFYHIFLFQNCTPKHIVDFEILKIQNNSLLFLDRGRVHQFDAELDYQGKIIIFTDDFYCIHSQDSYFLKSNILFNDLTGNVNFLMGESMSNFFVLCDSIKDELTKECDTFKREILKNYVHTFLLLADREKRKQGFPEIKKGADLDYVLLFKDLLEKHFTSIKQVSVYSEKLYISEKRLNLATSKILGKTPKQLIDNRIILEARRLLTNKTETIKAIAYILGFDEPTNFIKYFRKHTGKTPTEFREQPETKSIT